MLTEKLLVIPPYMSFSFLSMLMNDQVFVTLLNKGINTQVDLGPHLVLVAYKAVSCSAISVIIY